MLQAFFFAFLATVAFGILFQGPKRILVQSGVIGAAGWLLFITLKSVFAIHSFTANFLASLVVALLSEIAARVSGSRSLYLMCLRLFLWCRG